MCVWRELALWCLWGWPLQTKQVKVYSSAMLCLKPFLWGHLSRLTVSAMYNGCMSDVVSVVSTLAIAGSRALNRIWEWRRGNIIVWQNVLGPAGLQSAQSFVVHEAIYNLLQYVLEAEPKLCLCKCSRIFLSHFQWGRWYGVKNKCEKIANTMQFPLVLQTVSWSNFILCTIMWTLPSAALVNNVSDCYLLSV